MGEVGIASGEAARRTKAREAASEREERCAQEASRELWWLLNTGALMVLIGVLVILAMVRLETAASRHGAALRSGSNPWALGRLLSALKSGRVEVLICDYGLWLAALIPVGLLRILGAAIPPREAWGRRWRLRRSLYGRPLVKSIGFAILLSTLAAPMAPSGHGGEPALVSTWDGGGPPRGSEDRSGSAVLQVLSWSGRLALGLVIVVASLHPGHKPQDATLGVQGASPARTAWTCSSDVAVVGGAGNASAPVSDESWRIETREERHERRQRYAREAARHNRWLALTALLFMVGGVAGAVMGLAFDVMVAFLLLLFVPIGLMRLLSIFVQSSEAWVAWDLRRALYAHPLLKFFGLLMFLGPVLACIFEAQRTSLQDSTTQSTSESSTVQKPKSQDSVSDTGQGDEEVDERGGAPFLILFFCVVFYLVGGSALLVASCVSRERGVP